MEALIKNAAMAWNPVKVIQERSDDDSLNVRDTIIPYILIAVSCGLVQWESNDFFISVIEQVSEARIRDHALYPSTFLSSFVSVVSLLVPAVMLFLLPLVLYQPFGKTEVVSTVIVIGASLSFYSAIFTTPFNIIFGILIFDNYEFVDSLYDPVQWMLTGLLYIILLVFVYRIFLGVLKLSFAKTLIIFAFVFGAEFTIGEFWDNNINRILVDRFDEQIKFTYED